MSIVKLVTPRVSRLAPFRTARGFTVVELVALLGILALLFVMAVIQNGILRKRAQEAALKGKLGAVRAGLLLYYADTGGLYPERLVDLTMNKKYLAALPREVIPSSRRGNPGHEHTEAREQDYAVLPSSPGGFVNEGWALWGYARSPGKAHAFVNCMHLDAKKNPWSSW